MISLITKISWIIKRVAKNTYKQSLYFAELLDSIICNLVIVTVVNIPNRNKASLSHDLIESEHTQRILTSKTWVLVSITQIYNKTDIICIHFSIINNLQKSEDAFIGSMKIC